MGSISLEQVTEEICSDCVFKHLSLIDGHVTSVYAKALEQFELTPNQLSFLVVILKVSAITEVTPALFGKILGKEKSTVSRNLKRMEERGLVRFKTSDRGYASAVMVTEKGRKVVMAAYDSWVEAQKIIKDSLGEDLIRSLKSFSAELSEGVSSGSR
ncbi:MAG: MarR family winged helix-turn-helix transcriptional regulator [Verrucomicrobiota bacterium]